jgi:hypothetical protein
MKVNDIINGVTALQKLSTVDMPMSMALQLKKNTDECQNVLELFEQKRKAIVDKLDLKEGDKLPQESQDAIRAYLEETIEINIVKLSVSKLEAAEVRLSSSDISNTEWMFDFDA